LLASRISNPKSIFFGITNPEARFFTDFTDLTEHLLLLRVFVVK